jgi:hypothetical protein
MRTKTQGWPGDTTSSTRSTPLKASDFFPPGAGWNHQQNSDESARQDSQSDPNDQKPGERKH